MGLLGEICGGDAATETRREALAALMEHAATSDHEIAGAVRRSLGSIPAQEVVTEQLELLADEERSDRDEIAGFLKQLLEHVDLEPGRRAAAVERIRDLEIPSGD